MKKRKLQSQESQPVNMDRTYYEDVPAVFSEEPAGFIPSTLGNSGHAATGSPILGRKEKQPLKRWMVALIVAITLAILAVAFAAAYAFYYSNTINQEISNQNSDDAAAAEQLLTPVVSDEPFWVLILGSDTRGEDDQGRTDTNIAARVDPKTGSISLVSVPRDTAIKLGDYGTQKFNAAYTYGGIAGAITATEDLLGIQISHYVQIDFAGLVDLVDAMGGVTLDVPMEIEDANAGGHVDAGMQTLNGEQALIFARSRSYTTGDFQRATNQRILVEALMEKLFSMPATQLPDTIAQGAKSVTTDMNVYDILGYANAFKDNPDHTIYSVMVPSTTAESGGISFVVCDVDKLKQVMNAINKGEDPSPYVDDFTVDSSEQAQEEGQTATPIYVPN